MSGNAADFSGNIPRIYDDGLGPVLFAPYAADMARRVVCEAAPSRVLETAAGSGIVTRALRDALPPGTHLTATDLNPDMLDVARAKFRAEDKVVFRVADATALPFPDASFDAVICQFGVMFYPDKDKGYREVHRVLGPGGRYLFSVWDAHRYNAFGRIAHQVIGRFFPDDPPRFYEVPFTYHQIDAIKESLFSAGFGALKVSVEQRRQPVADVSSFAQGIVFGNPVFDQIRQRGGAEPAEIREAVAAALLQEFCGVHELSLQAIVFEARKV